MSPQQETFENSAAGGDAPGTYRIVVIEIESISASLRFIFEFFGHRVETACDGCSGIDLTKAIEPDIVFTRIELPDMDGYTVASAIRAANLKQPVLVAHTGYGKWEIGERAKKAGFDLLISKPAAGEDLLDALSFVAGKSTCEGLKL